MKIINLFNIENSDVKYILSYFPDGEIQISLDEIDRKDTYEIRCRVTNADELFILSQVLNILDRQGVEYSICCTYLMGMRMDRVMDFNRPFTLEIVGNILHNCKATKITLVEPHSDRIKKLFPNDNRFTFLSSGYDFLFVTDKIKKDDKYQIVFPDRGAFERYKSHVMFGKYHHICGYKKRDITTGKIIKIGFETTQIEECPLLFVDDLCDAGGTFVGLVQELKKETNQPIHIYVTHMVNRDGILNLSKHFDSVWFTDSYKDWKTELGDEFPENCYQFNLT